ncbi:MAG: sulfatase-like hydrolase/transferase [Planctomycetota bacterium]
MIRRVVAKVIRRSLGIDTGSLVWRFLFLILLLSVGLPTNALNRQPNIILIYCDDIGYADISAYAHAAEDTKTPQIDRLAERGVLFTQGYAASPICNVSRVAVTSGRYPQSTGTRWYGGPGLTNVPVGTTLAEQLRAGGYRTVSIGKHHFGSIGEPKNTDADLRITRDNPVNHGFDEFFGFIHSEKDYERNTQEQLDAFLEGVLTNGVAKEEAALRARQAVIGPMVRAHYNNEVPTLAREDRTGYTTDIFTDEAIRQLESPDQPLFMAINYNSLHTQLWNGVPDQYKAARGITVEEEQAYSPIEYDGSLPFWIFNNRFAWFSPGKAENKLGNIDDPRDTAANRFRRKLYLAALDHLDENIGRLLDALEAKGQLDSTIVVFTGDNGGSHNIAADNSPLTGHKYMLGEGGIRVPFIVSWIGQDDDGLVVDDAVSQMDLIDTVLSAAGLKNITHTDGRDLGGIIHGKTDQDYRTQLWNSGNDWVVRHGNWKLRIITQERRFPNFSEKPCTQLYRLDLDPGEQNNLAEDNPVIVHALTALHEEWVEKQYKTGPMAHDNSLIKNGSFENSTGVNNRALDWQYKGDADSIGATLGGAMEASDGLWRGYLSEDSSLSQITDHMIQAGDTFTLRLSVNTTGSSQHGILAQVIASDGIGSPNQSLEWKVQAIADDSDRHAWQSYEIKFESEEDADYLGKRIGLVFQAIGPEGYRAIDRVSLTVKRE